MPILALRNVSKSFGALTVADAISLGVPEGQARGSIAADAGTVWLDGTDVTRVSPMRRCRMGVGRSFQIPQPFGKLTVFENLLVAGVFGQGKTVAEVADEAATILDRTSLLPKANRPAGGVSLLDRKRLELARAMAMNPRILLLDEIAGGLAEAECGARCRKSTWGSRYEPFVRPWPDCRLGRLPGLVRRRPDPRRGRDAGDHRCQWGGQVNADAVDLGLSEVRPRHDPL